MNLNNLRSLIDLYRRENMDLMLTIKYRKLGRCVDVLIFGKNITTEFYLNENPVPQSSNLYPIDGDLSEMFRTLDEFIGD
jgi:hypothetical protein